MVWRVATDSRLSDSYADIRDRWSFRELHSAYELLDALDVAQEPKD